MTVQSSLTNHFQLRATVDDEGAAFAFHLLRGSDVVAKTRYSPLAQHTFGLTRAGNYRVKVYRRSADGSVSAEVGATHRFAGLIDQPSLPPARPVAIAGVSRLSAFVAHVFAQGNDVQCVVDPTGRYVGQTFCDLPVVAAAPEGLRLVGPEGYAADLPRLEGVSLRSGATNALTEEFHRYGAMQLYRIGRSAYLDGMDRGAHAIESFVLRRFSTRLPYTADIGEGTELGLGGLAIAIHPDSIVGRDCVIAQNVTIGGRQGGNGTPVIGDNVFIAPGANCLGGRIGSNVVVGAGSVVLDEVPDNCVVAGVPARVISRDMDRMRAMTHRRTDKGKR